MKKIIYITSEAPYSHGEAFILSEMIAIKELGTDLLIMPRDNSKKLFHKKAIRLINNTITVPIINFEIVWQIFKYIVVSPITFLRILNKITVKSRSLKIAFKNLMIFPKGLYISNIVKKISVSHIHAHWASSTATMAYIIYRITGVPWSFTAHRWDIPENNILREKCKTASFVRAIDENGRHEMIELINDMSLAKKIMVIHMGVDMLEYTTNPSDLKMFKILCPANLVRKKGHRYLLEACRILSDREVQYKCFIAGDGPLEEEIKEMVTALKIEDCIEFLGRVPHDRLFDFYGRGDIDIVVLPSIVTDDDEKEGIPVSLMEAMAFKIPVISTNTGGIRELIGDGSGIMIEEQDPIAIADSIEKLMNDKHYYKLISERGREKVEKDFNVNIISKHLLNLFSQYSFN